MRAWRLHCSHWNISYLEQTTLLKYRSHPIVTIRIVEALDYCVNRCPAVNWPTKPTLTHTPLKQLMSFQILSIEFNHSLSLSNFIRPQSKTCVFYPIPFSSSFPKTLWSLLQSSMSRQLTRLLKSVFSHLSSCWMRIFSLSLFIHEVACFIIQSVHFLLLIFYGHISLVKFHTHRELSYTKSNFSCQWMVNFWSQRWTLSAIDSIIYVKSYNAVPARDSVWCEVSRRRRKFVR